MPKMEDGNLHGRKCRTGKCGTNNARVENSGQENGRLENAGPYRYWKMKENDVSGKKP